MYGENRVKTMIGITMVCLLERGREGKGEERGLVLALQWDVPAVGPSGEVI
jgi:hypothetical protein